MAATAARPGRRKELSHGARFPPPRGPGLRGTLVWPGRPPVPTLRGVQTKSLHAGVDLGGTKIETVVMGDRKVLGNVRVPTPQTGADDVIKTIVASIRGAIDAAETTASQISGIGLGSPGDIEAEGMVGNARNVPGFDGAPVAVGSRLSEEFGGIPVKVDDDDVRVAVRGEWKRGARGGVSKRARVFVGTGVGGGPSWTAASDSDTAPPARSGTRRSARRRVCSCGQKGDLEAYRARGSIEAETPVPAGEKGAAPTSSG